VKFVELSGKVEGMFEKKLVSLKQTVKTKISEPYMEEENKIRRVTNLELTW
jgi:hypothetical protein